MTRLGQVHFIGIGGIGMSALARWFKAHGWMVSGSDAESSLLTRALRREGIRIARLPRTALLVVRSQVIAHDNPELALARKHHIPVLSYPELLGHITEASSAAIAIAGAHGKSTTTALVSLMLAAGKKDPTVIIGTLLKEFGNRNFRKGSNNLLVLEADEYGRAFLHYSPSAAIVTNIDREHLDVYPTLRDAQDAFLEFLSRVRHGGTLVVNRDNRPLRALAPKIEKLAAAHNLSVHWYSLRDSVAKNIRDAIQIPGEHNVSNALAAFTAATKVFGIPKKIALRALARYKGAWRRMEYKGRLKVEGGRWKEKLKPKTYNLQPMVYDDYAHHPAEIKATLAAFREKFPHSPLICVFQPHQALRLQKLFKDFVGAFDGADALILLPLYRVRGRDKINPRYTSKTLAAAIQKKYPRKPLLYVANPKKLKPALANVLLSLKPITYNLQPILVMMGAGDIVRFTDSLLKK